MRVASVPLVLLVLAGAARADVVTLAQAVELARANHPDVRRALADREAAAARVEGARAPLFPQIAGRASAVHNDPGPDQFAAAIVVDQLLWDFGRTLGRLDAARAARAAQDATTVATERQVLLDVRVAYFAARAARALVDVARETQQNQQRHLGQIEGFIAAGARPEIDRAQARTDVANARVALIRAENGYAVARAQLNLAMGVERSTDYEIADEPVAPVPGEDGDPDALVAEAERSRPEVAALSAQVAAAAAGVKAARGDDFPALSASGSVGVAGPAVDDLGRAFTVGVQLSWPLFQGLATRAAVREARAGVAAAEAARDAERQRVRLDVEQARLDVRGARAALAASGDALDAARERLRLAEGRYQTGIGSIIELGDAQVAMTNAAAQKVQADYDLATARVRLLHVLGR